MITTYIEASSRAALEKAILAVPYNPGETAQIVAKHSQGETRFKITCKSDEDAKSFEYRLRRMARNIRRSREEIWQ